MREVTRDGTPLALPCKNRRSSRLILKRRSDGVVEHSSLGRR